MSLQTSVQSQELDRYGWAEELDLTKNDTDFEEGYTDLEPAYEGPECYSAEIDYDYECVDVEPFSEDVDLDDEWEM